MGPEPGLLFPVNPLAVLQAVFTIINIIGLVRWR